MAAEWKPSLKEINGVNLANYFPHQRSYNSVVFIHKKYLNDYQNPEAKKEKVKTKKDKKYRQDKCQQFNSDKNTETSYNNRTYKVSSNNDTVLDQTIRFAKELVPLVIPQSDEKIPVFYTIKSSRRHRKKENKTQETSPIHHATTQEEKGDAKKVLETYRKVRKESFSVKESFSQGSSNTLDDLNINQSLCCTFSEVSEKKCHKKERSHHKKRHEGSKLVISESFEALATENQGESKIKVHLMNEKDKNVLSDSIKAPIISALRECISEISNCNNATEISRVQKILNCNSSKLDAILERISSIENKLDLRALERNSETRALEKNSETRASAKSSETRASEKKALPEIQNVQTPQPKSSALEDLEEDLIGSKDDFSSEEELHQESLYRRSKSAVTEFVSEEKLEIKRPPTTGGGEVTGGLKDAYSAAVKTDRPNRIPARFCWTDAARK
ncbi:hypothetical protein PYW07_005595 [Mythimna separata]|uniref:Uncharacterized protein n=1 Tax=Mythimna separata TaxID=271217 RepID=A0AAD7YJS9_MYTSE|nr:hypothetical protein PYW07_005595 [Mythimna separata]